MDEQIAMSESKKLKWDTICVKENMDIKSGESHVLPIHSTSAFSYRTIEDSVDVFTGRKNGFVYGRYGNPTVSAVERKLAQLESLDLEDEAFCIITASGMAAISTLCFSLIGPGDCLLTQESLYGGTTEYLQKILQKYGVEIMAINLEESSQVEEALAANKKIKMIYFESPTNPTLKCIDIRMISGLAKKYKVLSAIDNTFCTAYLQRPLNMGIDFVVHSTTKFINGHGNSLAGAIIGMQKGAAEKIWETMKLMGTNSNAWDAWLTYNGLKTLAVRMDRACKNAHEIALYLEQHQKVSVVHFPGLSSNKYHAIAGKQMSQYGAMLSFELEGGMVAATKFMNNTKICTIVATLGNVDTLLLHPASSSHLNIDRETRIKNGIADGLIRVSVGIENSQDVIADMAQALDSL